MITRRSKNCLITLSTAASMAMLATPASAEYPMTERDRTGAFLVPGPTPPCDGFEDHLADIGDLVVDGVTYLGEKAINTTAGVGLLFTGDTDTLFEEVNDTFSDLGSAAADLTAYTPLGLATVLIDVLPEGAVTDFLSSGAGFMEDLQKVVASGVVEGLNPLAAAETAINDLGEIAGDIGNVLVNLDDPLSAGNEFLKLQQKWNAAGALTYMLTEDDPMEGMKKALGALHRQVELVTSHGPGPDGKIASALFDHVMQESKNAIDSIGDTEEKKVATVMMASFATSFKQSVSEPNYRPGDYEPRHPFYSAEIVTVDPEWMKDDFGSGGLHDWGMWHPVVEDKTGCISLGDLAYQVGDPTPALKAVCGVEDARDVWWTRPIDYQLLWGDNCSGGEHDRSIWKPVCPAGFVDVGVVAYGNSSRKPLPNRIACLKNDINLMNVVDGQSAQLRWIANDEGSGAKFDVTLYNRNFAGIELAHAVPRQIDSQNQEFVRSLNVAIETPGTHPAHAYDQCVNFYSDYSWAHNQHHGRTTTLCNPCESHEDPACFPQPLSGINNQTLGTVSGWQCGGEIAGLMLYDEAMQNEAFVSCTQLMPETWDNKAHYAKLLKSHEGTLSANERQRQQDQTDNCFEGDFVPACRQWLASSQVSDFLGETDFRDEGVRIHYSVQVNHFIKAAKIACDGGEAQDCREFARIASHACQVYGAACLTLSEYLIAGEKMERDLGVALRLSEIACEHSKGEWGCGEAEALRSQVAASGKAFEPQPDTPPHDEDTLEQNRNACRQGNMTGCNNMALFHLTGNDTHAADWPTAVDYFETACTGGLRSACADAIGLAERLCLERNDTSYCVVAADYYAGDIPSHLDYDTALDLYERVCLSRQTGGSESQSVYGCEQSIRILREGLSHDPSGRKLAELHVAMCQVGHANGCLEAGLAVEQGTYSTPDPAYAAQYYTRACDMNLAEGCDALSRVSQQQDNLSSSTNGCELRGQITSVDTGHPASVSFTNTGSQLLYLYWIDYSGNENDYNNSGNPILSLASGESGTLDAGIGYVFSAFSYVDEQFKCEGVIKITEARSDFGVYAE